MCDVILFYWKGLSLLSGSCWWSQSNGGCYLFWLTPASEGPVWRRRFAEKSFTENLIRASLGSFCLFVCLFVYRAGARFAARSQRSILNAEIPTAVIFTMTIENVFFFSFYFVKMWGNCGEKRWKLAIFKVWSPNGFFFTGRHHHHWVFVLILSCSQSTRLVLPLCHLTSLLQRVQAAPARLVAANSEKLTLLLCTFGGCASSGFGETSTFKKRKKKIVFCWMYVVFLTQDGERHPQENLLKPYCSRKIAEVKLYKSITLALQLPAEKKVPSLA